MLLRSSSTPVLGSLLSSFSDSTPNNTPNHHEITKSTTNNTKISFHLSTIVSCNSSPISPSINDCDRFSHKGFRRAQSEGNLEGLDYAPRSNNEDQFYDSNQPKKFTGKQRCSMLQTITSFSFYNSRGYLQDEEDEEESDVEDDEELLERDLRGGDRAMALKGASFGLEDKVKNMSVNEVRVKDEICNVGFEYENDELVNQQMHLAKGLGIGFGGGCGGSGGGDDGGGFYSAGAGGDGGDKRGVEEYYKRMVEENPGNPLFLRNYAQYLYQSKGDLRGAEEYYSRAILADPEDGEIISQYAKLVWELHHDQDRAACYFERSVQASPEDSHVQAAYANFLWDTEDDEKQDLDVMPVHHHEGTRAFASA